MEVIPTSILLATSLMVLAQADPENHGIAEPVDPVGRNANPAPPDATDAARFTVELTDGSRLLGTPVNDSFLWKTRWSPLTLKWNCALSEEEQCELFRDPPAKPIAIHGQK